MLLQNLKTFVCSEQVSKSKRRKRMLYFSSTKALKRSRMTRGKKVMSKTSESTAGDLRHLHRFPTGHRSGEENFGGNDIEAMQQMFENPTIEQSEGQAVVANPVSNKSCHYYFQ